MEKADGLLGGKFLLKRQNDGTIIKTKLYVACVKLNLAITEAALSGARGGQKQPVLSAAPERGRREDMEIHIAAVFSIVNH